MEQDTATTETPESQAVVQELVRPRQGRMLGGVAQGLANRYNLPVLLVRALFVILTFGGGLGLALYGAGWFLIRSEDEPEAPAERFFSQASTSRSWIGIGLVFLAVLILLDRFTFLSGGVVWAVGLLVVGILLYTGDLPRLVQGQNDKEGVQQVTTSSTLVPTQPTASGADDGSASGPPPTPAPTPPILPPAARQPREKSFLGRITLGVILIGLGVLAILDNIPEIAIAAEPRHYMALAVTILGLGLMVGGFAGRARWLILVAVVLVPTMLFSPVFEYNWNSDDFDRSVTPVTFTDLDDTYQIDVGSLSIDLTQLPWDGEDVDLLARVDAGEIDIWVPENVAVVGSAQVDVGHVAGFGRESSGLGSPNLVFDHGGTDGTIHLDASVDVGDIQIHVGN
ncbi:MAG: PspC domain-containing protein [Acidimicrobiia bacterium]